MKERQRIISLNGRKAPVNLSQIQYIYRRYKERQYFLKYIIYGIIVREYQIKEGNLWE